MTSLSLPGSDTENGTLRGFFKTRSPDEAAADRKIRLMEMK
jgi:hypothetical protein